MSDVVGRRYVTVPVATLWASPDDPREVDRWAVAPIPDVVAWLADLDGAGARQSLQGRVLTQLECCEPALITGDPAGVRAETTGPRWLQIVAPMQPSAMDPRGYPGWVPAGHVGERFAGCPRASSAAGRLAPRVDAQSLIAVARTHLGLAYLWGGLSDAGLDCSGLVHLSLRRLGLVFPRDADDQYDACEHLPARQAHPGDLYFFAREGKRPHHVGLVTGPGRMLHAPETGAVVIEEALTPARQSTLIGAGRLPSVISPDRSAG